MYTLAWKNVCDLLQNKVSKFQEEMCSVISFLREKSLYSLKEIWKNTYQTREKDERAYWTFVIMKTYTSVF